MNGLIKRQAAIDAAVLASMNSIDNPYARITAMKAAGDGLAVFAGHKWTCRANGPMPQCDCGLTAALKQWKEASDGV